MHGFFSNKSASIAISLSHEETEALDMADISCGFAQRLRTLRKQKNLSQTELGKLAGLHYTHIGRFERGTSRPSSDTLKRLADALDVSSDYLLDGSTKEAAKAKFEDQELLRLVKKLSDAFLTKKHLQALAR
jgi:transcriptional regulator with XRE-family HTH domain